MYMYTLIDFVLVRDMDVVSLFYLEIQFSQNHLWKRLSFPSTYFDILVKNDTVVVLGLFTNHLSCFLLVCVLDLELSS